jgi:hypothetical protein
MTLHDRRSRVGIILAVVSLLLLELLPSRSLQAANGLANPDFDNGVAAWSAIDGSLAWNGALDVQACAGSGSASFSSPEMVTGKWTITVGSTGSCVQVSPGESVALRARVLFTAPAAATDFALLAYTDSDCSAGEFERGIAGYGPLPLIWMDFMMGLTIDPGTHSVRFLMRTSDPAVSTYGFALDRTYLGPAEPIFLDGLDAASTCRWSQSAP